MVGYLTFAIEHMMYGMALDAFIQLTSPATEISTIDATASRTPVAA